jgi:predicted SnoaL-like aldol condensation-catalyzing enzyme
MESIRDSRLSLLTGGVSRRTALRGLGGVGVATALGLAPRDLRASETAQASRELGSALAQDATPATGSTDANKAIVRRVFEEAINTHNPALVYELYAPEFIDRSASPGQLPGPAGIEQALIFFNTILPDVEVTVDASIAEGDLVATQETWRGTDPTTGRDVEGKTLHFWRLEAGKIIEEWSAGWEWLEQIGALAATPTAGG